MRATPPPVARYFLAIVAGCIVLLLGIIALPHDPYVRYQQLAETDYIKSRWIYERLHFDPTPVDVALIGTSHTLAGVDSALVEQAMRGAGGAPAHIANLALPHLGEDLHFAITKLLLANKTPRVVIVETHFLEARASHPAFPLLADSLDILTAPPVQPDAVQLLLQLTNRQLRLFLASLRRHPDDGSGFDVASYRGEHWDDAYRVTYHGGQISPPRLHVMPPELLARKSSQDLRDQASKASEYRRLGWLTFYYNESFLRALLDALKASGTRIVFLYLPTFGTTEGPVAAPLLQRYGEIWTPPADILSDPAVWDDQEHLNYPGARRVSEWLGAKLAQFDAGTSKTARAGEGVLSR